MHRLTAIVLGILVAVGLSGCPKPPAKPPPIHEPPPIHPEPIPLPKPEPLPPGESGSAALGSAGKEAVDEGEASSTEREVICFAYGEFYDPASGEFFLPSEEEFIEDVFARLLPPSEEEEIVEDAGDAYDLVSNLANGEFQAVAESLACG